jgi:hypothetical protein
MEMFSKIYKYEVDLHPYIASKRSSFTIYAITESLETAQQMMRLEYPSLLMYSVLAVSTCTLVDKNYTSDSTIFSIQVKTAYTDIKVLVVAHTLMDAIKACIHRYRLDIHNIEILPLRGNVIFEKASTVNSMRVGNNSIMRVG